MNAMINERPYNDFWNWKIGVEIGVRGHILDDKHKDEACRRLLNILPSWQTYRGVKCNYKKWLPASLSRIADAYENVRKYSLLDLDKIPREPLELIWHELGRVKTQSGNRNAQGRYFVIAVCKPLMFIWGQTPPFDSRNRSHIIREKLYKLSYGGRWLFDWWYLILKDFQRDLLQSPTVIHYCQSKAKQIYGSVSIIPYGRFFDIYYY
jgi:hypothetical protein